MSVDLSSELLSIIIAGTKITNSFSINSSSANFLLKVDDISLIRDGF